MATKKSASKKKSAQEELLESHIANLDRRIWRVQEEMIEIGINIISEWLSDADGEGIFEEAVDWLLGPDGDEMLESQSGVMAFEAVKYAIYQFQNQENDEDESDDEEEDDSDNSSVYYDNVREYFNV